ncbi:SPRY domain-containing protein [Ditylenchus destructor]|uniref:SPRY domain-containing protein n=1 Tax=Ditylenchus destructor TaxID=166010 RepID=A0AAD4R453_9BILA|nr:SPRY domain-containing protein [Ditylenchus destructor]
MSEIGPMTNGHQRDLLKDVEQAELSQTLQLLSEKARQASEEIGRLRQFQERITTNYNEFASVLDNQFEALLEELKNQRQKLLDFVEAERLRKKAIMKNQIGRCAGHLGKTTALIQFCIEVLKEPEPLAYIQVGNALATRVVNQEFLWHREMRTKPETDAEFVYTLDTEPLETAIRALDFVQLKAPPRPCFEPSACSAENNSVVVVWNCPQVSPSTIPVDGYSLEIDSGRDHGIFKEVYSGPDNVCTIDGLDFDTLYNARVKAFNSAGESEYSDPICLQTAQYASFHLVTDSNSPANNEFILSNDGISVVGTTAEYRTVLGSVSFARGLHYWEVSVDQYKGNSDVVLGVAQLAANRSLMLGKDIYGWSMYIDRERSWYFHNDSHRGRLSGGLDGEGTVIGVLMDCDRGMLSFYLNDAPLSDCAFRNMPRGHYIPAFSVNRNSRISVNSGMGPPPSVLAHIREAVQDRL